MPNDATDDVFADVLSANESYAADFSLAGVEGRAGKGILVLTCMDSRVEPFAVLGLRPGDAKWLRNAGGRVTDDVLSTLVVSRYLLGVDRVMVLAHTKCKMASGTPDDVHEAIRAGGGPDTRSLTFLATPEQEAALRYDVQRIKSWPYLDGLSVGGFRYDVDTGRVSRVC